MNKRKKVFMYSGQGSQYYCMGEELYIKNNIFRDYMEKMDITAKEIIGESVLQSLTMTLQESGICPDYVFGSSLGEYTALAVAGCVKPSQMLEIVIRQAQLLEAYYKEGSMLAVLEGE